jgi:HSP20 family protein
LQRAGLGGIIRVRGETSTVAIRESRGLAGKCEKLEYANDGGVPMAIDKFNLPHMFFLSEIGHTGDVWQPRADVYRTREGWLVKLELAGVRPDEIRLNIEDHRLVVQGSRRDEHCRSAMGCHCLEIAYSQFQRVVELPGLCEAAEIATSYVDGMLLLRIKMGNRS